MLYFTNIDEWNVHNTPPPRVSPPVAWAVSAVRGSCGPAYTATAPAHVGVLRHARAAPDATSARCLQNMLEIMRTMRIKIAIQSELCHHVHENH